MFSLIHGKLANLEEVHDLCCSQPPGQDVLASSEIRYHAQEIFYLCNACWDRLLWTSWWIQWKNLNTTSPADTASFNPFHPWQDLIWNQPFKSNPLHEQVSCHMQNNVPGAFMMTVRDTQPRTIQRVVSWADGLSAITRFSRVSVPLNAPAFFKWLRHHLISSVEFTIFH